MKEHDCVKFDQFSESIRNMNYREMWKNMNALRIATLNGRFNSN